MGRLTTHVLDTARGRPAAGLAIDLVRLDPGEHALVSAVTNADGRARPAPLLEGQRLPRRAPTSSVFHAPATTCAPPPPRRCRIRLFLDEIPIRFGIASPEEPLPRAAPPLALSATATYRGS
jgi:5-hydroxyisourate hydrolase